jgi:hypothetical protein
MSCRVFWRIETKISEEYIASIFIVWSEYEGSTFMQKIGSRLHGVTCHVTLTLILSTTRTRVLSPLTAITSLKHVDWFCFVSHWWNARCHLVNSALRSSIQLVVTVCYYWPPAPTACTRKLTVVYVVKNSCLWILLQPIPVYVRSKA